jgi:phage major head subunit gpT-like protein
MAITKHKLQTAGLAVTAAYLRGLQGRTAPIYEQFTTPIDMNTKTVEAPIAGTVGPLREWVGARVIDHLSSDAYKMTAKKFEKTIGISADAIDEDNIGVYKPSIEQLGVQTRLWPDQQVFKALEANGLCHDDKAFFATDHPEGSGTAANLTAGANPGWYVFDTSKPLKSMVWGMWIAPAIVPRTNPDDEHVFNYDEFLWGVRAKGVAAYGFWQTAYKHKGTLDAANFEAVCTAMRSRVDDQGETLDISPTLVVVSRANEFAAKRLFGQARLANGEDNIHALANNGGDNIRWMVANRLTGA